ncbi:hypothetical protein EW146_g830 [Bondarzewia mesenterica]|uniref:Uncharacterized protein n=1 Tax=Bondarzewia mesenterica TaxID=1095465 RepID=A0A4S4M5M5_9AGAM|nr:hypothetical protein EW146_g830 [Bondarzewia mesenterica]
MGQRHQVYVVARVRSTNATLADAPAKYRCIVALHHQWCYGRLPLLATRRFLTLVKFPENAEIIRWELDHIQDKGEEKNKNKKNKKNTLCPYTAFLLSTSWTASLADPENPYASSSFLFNPNMGSANMDNNDGITVIDISDPLSPAYCYVKRLPGGRPLTAKKYCRSYYPEPDPEELAKSDEQERAIEEHVAEVIASLDGEKVLEHRVLAETWPLEYRKGYLKAHPDGDSDVSSTPSSDSPKRIPELVEMAIAPAITAVIQGGDLADIQNILAQPDRHAIVKENLTKFSPFPDEAIPILSDVLGFELESNKKSVDITSLPLSTAQILQLLASFDGVEVLNLSYNPLVASDTIEEILAKHHSLRRIVCLACPSLSDADVASLLSDKPDLFNPLDAFIHPYFLNPTTRTKAAFSMASMSRNRFPYTISLPTITPTRIVQALIDFTSALRDEAQALINGILSESSPVKAVITGWRKEGQSWDERSVVVVPRAGHPVSEGWICILALDDLRMRETGPGWAFVDMDASRPPSTSDGADSSNVDAKSSTTAVDDVENNEDGADTKATDTKADEEGQTSDESLTSDDLESLMPAQPIYKVYDLRDFLARFSDRPGRVPAPEASVALLEEQLDVLKQKYGAKTDDPGRRRGLHETGLSLREPFLQM